MGEHELSDALTFAEFRLATGSALLGKTLKEAGFRTVHDINILGVLVNNQAKVAKLSRYRLNHTDMLIAVGKPEDMNNLAREAWLRDLVLEPGDALLVYGRREQLAHVQKDSDFLVLTGIAPEVYKREKAPLAAAIQVGVLASVALGWLPIYLAAALGAALMVLCGCLSMDEAYRAVEWKAVLLIAGMLGLGLALQETGATELAARTVLGALDIMGHLGILAGLFLITCLAAQVIPTAAVAVIMAPLALTAAVDFGLSPRALLMAVAVGSSSAFLSPVGHPVNLLVMGLGGYRFSDYTRVGLPLVLILLLITVFILPLLWPLGN